MTHASSQRPIKTFAINLLVFFIVTVFMLGAIEVYLRLTIPESSKESIFEWSLDTKRFKEMKKNTVIQAYGVELRTNSLGFRDNKRVQP
jgi:hypothetical protein